MGGHREETTVGSALSDLASASAEWGAVLSPAQLKLALDYLEDLARRNHSVNLTASGGLEDLLLRHFADGLAPLPILRRFLSVHPLGAIDPARASHRLCDVGSGGGFIGMALKIAWPEAEVTLLESSLRRFRFLSGSAARTGLKGLRVVRDARGEGGFDAVLERALAPLPEALDIAAPLMRPGGLFIAYQSHPCEPDGSLNRRLASLSLRLLESIPYRLPRQTRERYLAVFRKEEN